MNKTYFVPKIKVLMIMAILNEYKHVSYLKLIHIIIFIKYGNFSAFQFLSLFVHVANYM